MAASADRATRIRHPEASLHRFPYLVKGSTTIYKGTLVMVVAGYALPAADTSGGKVVGVAAETVVNAGSDGAATIQVDRGNAWHFTNGSGAIVQADVGKFAYVVDDSAVTDTANTNNVVAGTIAGIDPDDAGIWVAVPHEVEALSTIMVAIAAAGA